MDWRSVTFDWNRARAFLVTAEEGSLSAAARALGMTQPTLGRQVTALEEELGVVLFERVGRGLVLTQAGTQLMSHVRAMGEAAAGVSLAASGQAQAASGHVAVTASEIYSSWLMPSIAKRLREVAPGITLEVVASNEIRDLRRREADIAIRNARPEEPDLIAKMVGDDEGTFYATDDYLKRLGPVSVPEDLARADFVGFGENESFVEALQRRGIPVTPAHFPVLASSHAVHWEMTRGGLGVGTVPCGLGDSTPGMRRVLPEVTFNFPVWLVAHRELRTSPRVRIVWELLAEMLPTLLSTAR
ncbi:LysR family transcriptional regulator [Mameliella alba]|nr:LysR family transcriptional regulator [Mameliella sediminis]MBY6113840.1 LysR family transcriptional regulator [Antarctobacter heliothermus]MBY6142812.1 LysR family transcriptional regulator [Mameliella alba]MBV7395137.1 LysR family transcriptional regulator [Mameliella sediminis]MBY6159667.1 LysR family transcriptional regulator [Mameliella alba]MBY6168138.1 LysR family transcriptional regulator [Mameliella alba]